MKDYYYILGISKAATLPEIQEAYKKLALKFHPDTNDNDPFFVHHYQQIKEAYQVLSDDNKRFRYDKAVSIDLSAEVARIIDGPAPVITSFFASKKASKKGDLLTLSWEVLNADDVHIDLIGQVATNGTQTIRIMEEAITQEFLSIGIKATNNQSNETSTKNLKIKNLSYSPSEAALQQRQQNRKKKKSTPSVQKTTKKTNQMRTVSVEEEDTAKTLAQQQGSGIAYLLIVVMIFIILVMLYTMHTLNPMF